MTQVLADKSRGEARGAKLPGLLVIGAMKASTTAFAELLSRHPGVWFSPVKEPHYFTARDYGEPAALERYAKLFADAPEGAVTAEASTGYSKLPHLGPTPQRIREVLGEPKLIYLLRDPVQRLISNFHHSRIAGHYDAGATLGDVIESDTLLVAGSCYARQIRAYHDEFGESSLLLLTTDELHTAPRAAMRRVEEHLGLEPFDAWPDEMPSQNARGDLAGSLALRRFGDGPLFQRLRALAPAGARQAVKRLLSRRAEAPAVTDAEVAHAQSLIEEDLRDLVNLLGSRIDDWPSVRRLRHQEAPCNS